MSKEQGFQNWLAVAFVYRAWTLAKDGDLERGIKELREGIALFRGIGARLTLVGMYAMVGDALLLAGDAQEAVAALDEGICEAEARTEHLHEPELYRLRGEALRRLGAREAEASFRQALALARQQRARPLSLRAALSLTRSLGSDRPGEAQRLLEEEYRGFTQGFETPDLQEARLQLAALA